MINTQTQQYDKVKSDANKALDKAGKKVNEFGENVADAAHTAGEKVRHFLESARDELSDASDKVTTQIRQKPVQSSLIALAAGFAIGALFRKI